MSFRAVRVVPPIPSAIRRDAQSLPPQTPVLSQHTMTRTQKTQERKLNSMTIGECGCGGTVLPRHSAFDALLPEYRLLFAGVATRDSFFLCVLAVKSEILRYHVHDRRRTAATFA